MEKIEKKAWGILGKEVRVAELSFRCMVSHCQFSQQVNLQGFANKTGGRPCRQEAGRPHPGAELSEDCHLASVSSSQ